MKRISKKRNWIEAVTFIFTPQDSRECWEQQVNQEADNKLGSLKAAFWISVVIVGIMIIGLR